MADAREQLGLDAHALREVGSVDEMRGEDLDRSPLAERSMHRLVDLAHRPLADEAHEIVGRALERSRLVGAVKRHDGPC